jgi:hypothetical protein
LDWILNLLITYTHHSELQAITAPPLISTIHKSPTHFSCRVFICRSLATTSNNGNSSASCAQVLSPQPPLQNSTELKVQSCVTTDGQSASLSWNKALIWGLRPDLYFCQRVAGLLMWGALSDEGRVGRLQLLLGLASAVVLGSDSHGTRNHILLLRFETSHLVGSTTRRATVVVLSFACDTSARIT